MEGVDERGMYFAWGEQCRNMLNKVKFWDENAIANLVEKLLPTSVDQKTIFMCIKVDTIEQVIFPLQSCHLKTSITVKKLKIPKQVWQSYMCMFIDLDLPLQSLYWSLLIFPHVVLLQNCISILISKQV